MLKNAKPAQTPQKFAHWGALMAAAQQGAAKSYRKLLRELEPVLAGFVRNRLFNDAAVEDVVQEIFLAVHKARATYRPEQPFHSWVFALARYKLIDYLRKHQRGTAQETDLAEFETFLADPANTPETTVGLRHDLAFALGQLPQKQREVLQLLKLEELSVQEVSAKLNMTMSNVKVTAHRALKALQSKFEEQK